jgi:hypothetical protein
MLKNPRHIAIETAATLRSWRQLDTCAAGAARGGRVMFAQGYQALTASVVGGGNLPSSKPEGSALDS